ncbi:hypothetical protein P5V15_014891 [Pogonomyrmex californicus]
MTLMLRTYAFTWKKLFFKDFHRFECGISCTIPNACNFERRSTGCNIKYFSTKDCQKTVGRTEIYYGPLTKHIKALKLFSLLTSTFGLSTQPFIYLKAVENDNVGALLGISACIGFLAITTPFLIHIITKKYVTHLYYDAKQDIYIANTYSLFARTKELTFVPEDVVVPDVTGMFTNCVIKNIPLFLESNFFYDRSHYIRIMGYDKPMDFKLNNNNQTVDRTMDTKYTNDNKK